MQPLTFACSSCGKRVGVPAEYAGRKVRCPHCKTVVTAPLAASAPPAPAPTLSPSAPTAAARAFTFSAPQREGADSIFGEAEDAEDSLFAAPQPKLRPPPSAPAPPEPVAPSPPAPVGTSVDVPASEAPDDNPFADMAGAAPPAPVTSPGEPPEVPKVSMEGPAAPKRSVSWQIVVIVLLAGYSFVVTILAAWGWLRTPAAAPDPAPAKAQKK